MSYAGFHADGKPVAPSALAPDAQVWVVDEQGEGHMVDCPEPRALEHADIQQIIADYRQAALNAISAGFDGIEVHGGNGYLIDQFLRRTSNQRTDEYGGSLANRIRFAQEVLEAISDAIGATRTGIRLSPFITQRGMNDPQVIDAILALAAWCERKVSLISIWQRLTGTMRLRFLLIFVKHYAPPLAALSLSPEIIPRTKWTNY
jgi:N-ethylmaleimide reductase